MKFSSFSTASLAILLTACGGGGGNGGVTPPPAQQQAPAATQTVTFQVSIPLAAAGTSANTRRLQYVAPQTQFFFVDLQGSTDPQFEHTFTVTASTCPVNTTLNEEQCSFTASVPTTPALASQQWSFVAANGTPGSPAATILGVLHDVGPATICSSGSCTSTFYADLNAVVANVVESSFSNTYPSPGYCGVQTTSQSGPPYLEITPTDPFHNQIFGHYDFANLSGDTSGFVNPITIAEDDASGEVLLAQIAQTDIGPTCALPGTPAKTLTLSTLAGAHGISNAIEVVDNATTSRTVHITYSVDAVQLQPGEFPQLSNPWTSPGASGTLLTLTCAPPNSVPSGTNPCAEVFP